MVSTHSFLFYRAAFHYIRRCHFTVGLHLAINFYFCRMKKLLPLFAIGFLFFSCKKEEPAPEPTPVTTGVLKGKVTHYDQFGTKYTNNLNTTTVNIVGTNRATLTDVNGDYTFESTSTGNYTLTFNKPGCGQAILQDIHYKYTDTSNYNVSIADIPSFSITNAYVKDTLWFSGTLAGIYYNANTSPANSKASTVAIIGKSAGLTISDPLSYVNFAPTSLINTMDYGRFLSYSFLSQTYGFKKDSIIFVKIYPVANTGAGYIDNVLNRPVYKAYGNPYATFTLTMP